jgi:hypothetical protein
MPHLRRASLRILVDVYACAFVLCAASTLLCQCVPCPAAKPQIACFTRLPMPPALSAADLSLGERIPVPTDELRDEVLLHTVNGMAVELEPITLQPAQSPAKAEPARIFEMTATRVIAASAIEDSVADDSGPSPAGGNAVPGEAIAEQSMSPVVPQQPAEKPAATPPAAESSGSTSKSSLLPEWLRRLPETVANLPSALSDAVLPKSTPHSTPIPKPKSTPASLPKQPARPQIAAKPRIVAKPQPIVYQKVDDSWHEPETLLTELSALAGGPAANWTATVLRQLAALKPALAAGSDKAAPILDRLDALSQQTLPLTTQLSDRAFARKWRETGYALGRRVDVWRQIARLEQADAFLYAPPTLDPQRLADCLATVEDATNGSPEGKAWQTFLLLDDLNHRCVKQSPRDERSSCEIAEQVLARMTQIPLTAEQQRFISSPSLTALRLELWRWAARPIGLNELLRNIELYERTRLPSDARRLAVDCQSLSVSPVEARRCVAERVDTHYRNANLRFTIAEKFLNDLIPEQKTQYAPVTGTVVGRPMQGESLMEIKIAVHMVPDPNRALLALEVSGEIAALTNVDAGMASFENESEARYIARKLLEINMEGIILGRGVDIDVQSETRLKDMKTSLDNVPLINWIARAAARGGRDMNMPAATEEMKQKIANEVTERINTETRQRFGEVVDRLNQRVFDPLNSLVLDPQLIDAKTEKDQFTMRLRLGGEDQLGSHTPRPPAPSDSLANLQIHESVINNGIQRLRLDGRTFTLRELSQHVGASLNCPALWPANSENDDVTIAFAKHNSVVVRFQDGQVSLTLSIARLTKGTRYRWNNFQVYASYKPVVRGRSAQLVRESPIELSKRNIGTQAILKGVFSHALSRKTPWELIPQKIVNQPKLQNAAVTQFVIEDGWIALSLGQKQTTTARRTRLGSR